MAAGPLAGRESSVKRVFCKRLLTVATPEAAETKTTFFDRPDIETMTTEKH